MKKKGWLWTFPIIWFIFSLFLMNYLSNLRFCIDYECFEGPARALPEIISSFIFRLFLLNIPIYLYLIIVLLAKAERSSDKKNQINQKNKSE